MTERRWTNFCGTFSVFSVIRDNGGSGAQQRAHCLHRQPADCAVQICTAAQSEAGGPRGAAEETPGRRPGADHRAKKRRHRPAELAIIMGNVRSLGNKTAELAALIKSQREYRVCSVLCYTESWLHSHIPVVPGFSTVREDRDVISSGKKKVGGMHCM